jgi:hypothetical protein
MLHELFHTQVGITSIVALIATILVGVVVSILMVTRVLKADK